MAGEDIAVLRMLDEDLREFDSLCPIFEGERFDDRLCDLIQKFLLMGRKAGSTLPVRFFQDAVREHPDRGLAWYGLFNAIELCGSSDCEERERALRKAVALGCGYVKTVDGKVEVTPIGAA